MKTFDRRTTRTLAAGLFAVTGLGLAGCGEEEPVVEEPAVEEPAAEGYEGVYDQAFYDDIDTYVDQDVTLTGEVEETLTPDTFTLGGDADPLLVVESEEIPALDVGQEIEVVGTVEQAFEIVVVEEDLGIDLDDEMYVAYEGEPYLMATSAEVLEAE